ncbi:hypothetical protein KUL25_00250 [Rhodobacteraceae bacterium N5(2021)]|uniref:Uncharacterized protein n=1 Tax=Gymnodinialimonas phycosphaerae TaxID=2841589 RepID=A0A975TUN9_9RHOB|nr:hypothetical protein [Gymnodinialimonas phycosphaerae]MBY4891190.1 hypothetical protein [Gymnodinialimonas phycosphaerae]
MDAHEEVTGTTTFSRSGGPRFVLSLGPAGASPASAFTVINTTIFEATTAEIVQNRHDWGARKRSRPIVLTQPIEGIRSAQPSRIREPGP